MRSLASGAVRTETPQAILPRRLRKAQPVEPQLPPFPPLPKGASSNLILGTASLRPEQFSDPLSTRAAETLVANDMGFAVKPSPRLYPHQWNWDSGFIAIGLARFDNARAQREVLKLLGNAWKNGMVPHIVFNPEAHDYFPGPETWRTDVAADAPVDRRGRHVATSGHTQPPVLALAARTVFERGEDRAQGIAFLKKAYPGLKKYQDFFRRRRDLEKNGLAYTIHPWETGRDNAPEWLTIMRDMKMDWTPSYQRRDTAIIDAAERPTESEYDRFIYLVELFRKHGYDAGAIERHSPFLAQDVLMNALVHRSNEDLMWIAKTLRAEAKSTREEKGFARDIAELERRMKKTRESFSSRFWDEDAGLFRSFDLRAGTPIEVNTVATFLPLFAGLATPSQAKRLVEEHLLNPEEYWLEHPLPSTAANDAAFDAKKYWLGPAWVNINWMVIKGLERYGYDDVAAELRQKTLRMIEEHGFFEYFNAHSGSGHGTDAFSWTASLALDLIEDERQGASSSQVPSSALNAQEKGSGDSSSAKETE